MREELITFETAKLAKEKGFNIHCRWRFDDEDGTLYENEDFPYNSWNGSLFAPTQSLLQRWLREVHNIHICVDIDIEDNWYFNIYNLKSKRNSEFDLKLENNRYETYEQALEIGLQEALKLIKIK